MNPQVSVSVALAAARGIFDVARAPKAYIDPNTGGMLFQVLAIAFTFFSGIMLFFSARIRMAIARGARRLRGMFRHDTETH